MVKRKPVGWRGEKARHREAALKGKRESRQGITRFMNPMLKSRRKFDGVTFTREAASYNHVSSLVLADLLRKRGYHARIASEKDGKGNEIFAVYKRSKKNPVPYR